jgi:hypothetical protein
MEASMWEYHIFLHGPDDPAWGVSSVFTVHAVGDDAVRSAFPHADRIYRFENPATGLVRIA